MGESYMIRKIYFDWHEGNKDISGDNSFGQITYVNEFDEIIDVHNLGNISEEDFYKCFLFQKEYAVGIYSEYGEI